MEKIKSILNDKLIYNEPMLVDVILNYVGTKCLVCFYCNALVGLKDIDWDNQITLCNYCQCRCKYCNIGKHTLTLKEHYERCKRPYLNFKNL